MYEIRYRNKIYQTESPDDVCYVLHKLFMKRIEAVATSVSGTTIGAVWKDCRKWNWFSEVGALPKNTK